MRMPIRLNESFWPRVITSFLPSSDDPRVLLDGKIRGEEFSRAVSVFKFGTTFKTTGSRRFPATVKALVALDVHSPVTVLDVGASDGISSLHVRQSIDFDKFYVTDLNTEVLYDRRGDRCYFYDTDHNCILIATKWFVIHSASRDSLFPLNKIADYLLSKSPNTPSARRTIELINPEVRTANGNVVVVKYDIFTRWMNEKVNLILAANILNRSYFTDHQILEAIDNLVHALADGGRLVIVDNRETEKATIFRVTNDTIEAEKDIHGGTEIRELILRNCLGQTPTT